MNNKIKERKIYIKEKMMIIGNREKERKKEDGRKEKKRR